MLLHDKAYLTAWQKSSGSCLSPGLGVILVGNRPDSELYVRMKGQAAETVGMVFQMYHLNDSINQLTLNQTIAEASSRADLDGIILQLPLPPHLDSFEALCHIHPMKDVDGLHPYNVGLFHTGRSEAMIPCTALSAKVLLDQYGIDVVGRHVVVLSRSRIVGEPIGALMAQCDAVVTMCPCLGADPCGVTSSADILVVAAGVPHHIKPEHVRENSTVIDVGITRVPGTRRVLGDVHPDVAQKVSFLTPVPGGVGPLTVACAVHNTLRAFAHRTGVDQFEVEEFCRYRPGMVLKELGVGQEAD
jgi:methylenetetrahydrofolate dehydrogenase (NADP+)/methenyltetrahydrofolate cyclohydrolase